MSKKVINKILYLYILIMICFFPQNVKASEAVQTPEKIVAQIGEQTFESIDDAIACGDNLNIKLLDSVSAITIPAGKTVNIETNGNNIKEVVNYGILSIKNTSDIESKIVRSRTGVADKYRIDIVSISNEEGATLKIENMSIETNVDLYSKTSTVINGALRVDVKGILNNGDLYVNNCEFILKGKGEAGYTSDLYVCGIDNHGKLTVENSDCVIEGESVSHGVYNGMDLGGICNVIGICNDAEEDMVIDNTNFTINYYVTKTTKSYTSNCAIYNKGAGNVYLNMIDINCLMTGCRNSVITDIAGIVNDNTGKVDISNSRIDVQGMGYYNHNGTTYGIECTDGILNVGTGDEITEINVQSDYGRAYGIHLWKDKEKICNVENAFITVQSENLASYGIDSSGTILSLGKADNLYSTFPVVYGSIYAVVPSSTVYLYSGLYGSDKDKAIMNYGDMINYPEGAHEVTEMIAGVKFHTISDIYNITYNLNGGKWLTDKVFDSYKYGTSLILSDQVIKDGYTFEGWYRSSDFSGEPVSEIGADSCEDIVLYAKWNKHSHIWDNGKVIKNATCTENGKKTYVCKVCGETKIENILATGHVWDSGVVTKEPTAKNYGEKTYTCTICNVIRIETISKLPENPGVNIKIKKPQNIKVTATKTISAKKVKKKAQSFCLSARSTSGNKVKYKLVNNNKNIKFVASSGKVTVKKGTKKGTYKIKVKMTVSGNNKYKAYSTKKTITVKVK